jgi:hypothetical protein
MVWPPDTYRTDEEPSTYQERALALQVSRWGGTEIRPTRVFLWLGGRERGQERILALGASPRLLRIPRRRRHLEFLGCRVSYLGNPAVTLGLFLAHAVRGLLGGGRRAA